MVALYFLQTGEGMKRSHTCFGLASRPISVLQFLRSNRFSLRQRSPWKRPCRSRCTSRLSRQSMRVCLFKPSPRQPMLYRILDNFHLWRSACKVPSWHGSAVIYTGGRRELSQPQKVPKIVKQIDRRYPRKYRQSFSLFSYVSWCFKPSFIA